MPRCSRAVMLATPGVENPSSAERDLLECSEGTRVSSPETLRRQMRVDVDQAGWLARKDVNVRIAQLAPPFVSVPPAKYGGTELVVHNLTEELVRRGHEVTLF